MAFRSRSPGAPFSTNLRCQRTWAAPTKPPPDDQRERWADPVTTSRRYRRQRWQSGCLRPDEGHLAPTDAGRRNGGRSEVGGVAGGDLDHLLDSATRAAAARRHRRWCCSWRGSCWWSRALRPVAQVQQRFYGRRRGHHKCRYWARARSTSPGPWYHAGPARAAGGGSSLTGLSIRLPRLSQPYAPEMAVPVPVARLAAAVQGAARVTDGQTSPPICCIARNRRAGGAARSPVDLGSRSGRGDVDPAHAGRGPPRGSPRAGDHLRKAGVREAAVVTAARCSCPSRRLAINATTHADARCRGIAAGMRWLGRGRRRLTPG